MDFQRDLKLGREVENPPQGPNWNKEAEAIDQEKMKAKQEEKLKKQIVYLFED